MWYYLSIFFFVLDCSCCFHACFLFIILFANKRGTQEQGQFNTSCCQCCCYCLHRYHYHHHLSFSPMGIMRISKQIYADFYFIFILLLFAKLFFATIPNIRTFLCVCLFACLYHIQLARATLEVNILVRGRSTNRMCE